MKKFLLSIMTLVYLASASGIAMQVHYCMGEQAGASLFTVKKEKCSRCGMTEKRGCCSDEHTFYKLDDAHQHVKAGVDPAFQSISLLPVEAFTFAPGNVQDTKHTLLYANPDPPPGSFLHKFICVYRI